MEWISLLRTSQFPAKNYYYLKVASKQKGGLQGCSPGRKHGDVLRHGPWYQGKVQVRESNKKYHAALQAPIALFSMESLCTHAAAPPFPACSLTSQLPFLALSTWTPAGFPRWVGMWVPQHIISCEGGGSQKQAG